MRKKLFVIAAVVVAVMVFGIGSALAFGPAIDDTVTQNGRYGDCDGTCDNDALKPQDGTGNQYGARANGIVCDGTCDEDRDAPRDGTGNQFGMRAGNRDNNGICGNANGGQGGRGGQCGRNR